MAKATTSALRGFDSFPVSLGDELRGERASLGRSLLDVQRDLRIKAAHIDAIECADPSAIPYPSYVTGYVRAYARYLGMDEDTVLRRFCAESGFVPPVASARVDGGQRALSSTARGDLDAVLAGSRLAAVSRAENFSGELGSTLRAAGSLAVLMAVVGGLGYGSWALLQNIQRVDFSPLPDAPTVVISAADLDPSALPRPDAAPAAPVADSDALAAIYAMQELVPPRVDLRDGPISTIDPRRAGVYAAAGEMTALRASDIVSLASPAAAATPVVDEPEPEPVVAEAVPEPVSLTGVALVVSEDAWVRVRTAEGRVVHEALMRGGSRWAAPEGATGLNLRAGNAGAVFVEIDGTAYGPLGRPGGVVSNISLDRDAVRSAYAPGEPPVTTSALDAPLRTR